MSLKKKIPQKCFTFSFTFTVAFLLFFFFLKDYYFLVLSFSHHKKITIIINHSHTQYCESHTTKFELQKNKKQTKYN